MDGMLVMLSVFFFSFFSDLTVVVWLAGGKNEGERGTRWEIGNWELGTGMDGWM